MIETKSSNLTTELKKRKRNAELHLTGIKTYRQQK